ncbi:MAG: type II toxin-antitoxin system MqsA family antitoxin [Aeromonas caviae]|nr:type II toxin-antitoxin system MqsA family antitoxin [Aeromonas caviae]
MVRDIFAELTEGFEALDSERNGKVTLRQHKVTRPEMAMPTPVEMKRIRSKLHLSQPVFADYLRVSSRTLQNWEQGKSRPTKQAVLLMKMVERDPKVLQLLATL